MVFMLLYCIYGQKFTFNIGPQMFTKKKDWTPPIVAVWQKIHRLNIWASNQNVQFFQEGKASSRSISKWWQSIWMRRDRLRDMINKDTVLKSIWANSQTVITSKTKNGIFQHKWECGKHHDTFYQQKYTK